MSKVQKIIFLIIGPAVFFSGLFFWNFFIKTFTMSELLGRQETPGTRMMVSMFDFDTGATRYDLYTLEKKFPEWERRKREISKIEDQKRRKSERDNLTLEMLNEPLLMRLSKKTLGLGVDVASITLDSVFGIVEHLK